MQEFKKFNKQWKRTIILPTFFLLVILKQVASLPVNEILFAISIERWKNTSWDF